MRRAFTLIEMIAVTAILLLLATMIVPSLFAIKRSQDLRIAVDALRRLPDDARAEARRTNEAVSLRIDGDAMVIETAPAEGEASEIRRIPLDVEISVESAQRNGEITDVASWLWTVYPDGTGDTGGITFRIGQSQRSMVLERSGAVRWIEGELPEQSADRWPAGERVPRV